MTDQGLRRKIYNQLLSDLYDPFLRTDHTKPIESSSQMTDLKSPANLVPSASELRTMLDDLILADLLGPANGLEGTLDKPIVCAFDSPRLMLNYLFRNLDTLWYNRDVSY